MNPGALEANAKSNADVFQSRSSSQIGSTAKSPSSSKEIASRYEPVDINNDYELADDMEAEADGNVHTVPSTISSKHRQSHFSSASKKAATIATAAVADGATIEIGRMYKFKPTKCLPHLQLYMSLNAQQLSDPSHLVRRPAVLVVLDRTGNWWLISCCGVEGWVKIQCNSQQQQQHATDSSNSNNSNNNNSKNENTIDSNSDSNSSSNSSTIFNTFSTLTTFTRSTNSSNSCSCSGAFTEIRSYRRYEDWRGRNHFLLHGRLMFGSDLGQFLVTNAMIIAVAAVFFACVCSRMGALAWLYHVLTALVLLYSLANLWLVSLVEPGILPRNPLHLDVPLPADAVLSRQPGCGWKFCQTCNVFRPPRTKHCTACQNCVRDFDHHCPYTSNCVGRRNRRYFMRFLFSFTGMITAMCAMSVYVISRDASNGDGANYAQNLSKSLLSNGGAFAEVLITICTMLIIVPFCWYHVRIAAEGLTTNEELKRVFHSSNPNPYAADSSWQNYAEVCCSSQLPSLLPDLSQQCSIHDFVRENVRSDRRRQVIFRSAAATAVALQGAGTPAPPEFTSRKSMQQSVLLQQQQQTAAATTSSMATSSSTGALADFAAAFENSSNNNSSERTQLLQRLPATATAQAMTATPHLHQQQLLPQYDALLEPAAAAATRNSAHSKRDNYGSL